MPVFLNAFPLRIPDAELEALQVPYDKEALDGLRAQYGTTHSFRRQGDNILIFSGDGMFPISGTPQTIAFKDNFGIFCSLAEFRGQFIKLLRVRSVSFRGCGR